MNVNFDELIEYRQRRKESPYLFSLYFDYVLKFAADKFDKTFHESTKYEIP